MDGRRSTVNHQSTISTLAAQTLELATYVCNALCHNRTASYPAKIKQQRLSLLLREALLPRNVPQTRAPCLAALAAHTKGRWTLIQTEWASAFACAVDTRNNARNDPFLVLLGFNCFLRDTHGEQCINSMCQ
jgi:hypothetical protein